MRATISVLATVLSAASLASAAPAQATGSVEARQASRWTLAGLSRTCNAEDTECAWTFGIQTGEAAATACTHRTFATGGGRASQVRGSGPSTCGVPGSQPDGAFTVTSGWSDQFGVDRAYTTLSVVNDVRRQIIYPAYTDAQVASGQVVVPDASWPVEGLP